MAYCYTCGYGNEDGAKFCYSCGRQMVVAAPAVQPSRRKSRKAIAGIIVGSLFAVVVLVVVLASVTGGESTTDGSAADSGSSVTLSSVSGSNQSTVLPTPSPTIAWNPRQWETGQYETKKVLKWNEILWVGAIGNGGLESGRYEYRDARGGKVVNESDCYLMVNLGELGLQQEHNLARDKPFHVTLRQVHQYASFGAYYGGRCRGGLYKVNP